MLLIGGDLQCKEKYVLMHTLCIGKLYEIREVKESYTKCAHTAQAAKLVSLKGLNVDMYIFKKKLILIGKYVRK